MSKKKAAESARKSEAEFSRKRQEMEERSRDAAVTSGNAVARMAAYQSQVGEIQAAEGRARAKEISTTGKVVGTQSLASSAVSGVGSTVADIGVDENIEADELDPNMVRTGLDTPNLSAEPARMEPSEPAPVMTPEEQEREWERYHSMDYDLEL